MIWGEIVTGLTVIGLVYVFLRDFKNDINLRFDALEKRMDRQDSRLDGFDARFASIEARFSSMDERMFYLATGRTLAEAVMQERIRRNSLES